MVRKGERLIVPVPAPGSEAIYQATPTPLPPPPDELGCVVGAALQPVTLTTIPADGRLTFP